jgi:non-lysosomal glucosylceramidase
MRTRRPSIHLIVLAACLFTSCGPQPQPAATGPAPADSFSPIPAAAWSRGIGVPYDEAVRPYVEYPMIDDGAWGGVPLGGLGAGSIGRTPRGDFARWHLDLGSHLFQSLPVNQFSICVEEGGRSEAHVLSPLRPDSLTSWNWDMPVGAGTYSGLFPRAWFSYVWDALPVRIRQMQFSPVIPGNYQESSYPVAVFVWDLENPTEASVTVSLLFTWQNLVGWPWRPNPISGNWNQAVSSEEAAGVVLTRSGDSVTEEWDGSYALAAPREPGLTVSYRTRFDATAGEDLWADFSDDGMLSDGEDLSPSGPGEAIAAGLAVRVELQPGEQRSIPFALAWDFPITEFGDGTQWYKRYTRFYGTGGRSAFTIASEALTSYPDWLRQIEEWQSPILDDPSRPDWYKTALFNELYYLVDGGTVWTNGRVGDEAAAEGLGHFAYLECFDYPFYNTFDVHFYASYALAMLWPELELGLLRDFVATVPQGNLDETMIVASTGEEVPRKIPGSVPHDLGSPAEDPWLRPNAFTWRDIGIWKDLNSKFVLEVWRDYRLSGDLTLIEDSWESVGMALDYLHAFDLNGDGLPDHAGVPDQTYDNWVMTGASAYGGGLWLAALEAAIEMGRIVGDEAAVARYTASFESGQASYEALLWNGQYYDFDASGREGSDSIMADQLLGVWAADITGLPSFLPDDHVATALETIYSHNVAQFAEGQMGAVNGMFPNGTVDRTSDQSQEVWTGTTYTLAALLLRRGLVEEAWATAWGVYNVTYNRGLWFRTPEAWLENGEYRASIYMRPLAIWAIEAALTGFPAAIGAGH